MKLLSKSQINTQVATQRKNQIDEGVMIAKKVDALRETLANLQTQHALFLQGMETELKKKTETLVADISTKEKIVNALEIRNAELLKPLDDKWKEVKDRELLVQNKVTELEDLEKIQNKKIERLDEKIKKEADLLSFIKIRERELIKVIDKTEENKEITEKVRKEIEEIKDKQLKYGEAKEKELSEREKGITSYEFTLKMKAEQLEMKEKEIEEEKIQLLDQRATLERALKRTTK